VALLRASVLKLRHRSASWVVLAILVALIALVFAGLAISANDLPGRLQIAVILGFPNAYLVLLGIILGFGGLLAVTYGAAVIGAEWAWGTIRAVVARGESRVRYTLVTFAALALVIAVGTLVAFAFGAALAVLAADSAGVGSAGATDPETLTGLPELLARTWFGLLLHAAIGFAIAMLFRSQLAGIGAGLAVYFAEIFLAIVPAARDLLPYFPFNVAQSVVTTAEGFGGRFGGGRGPGAFTPLDGDSALLLAGLYLVLALGVASFAAWRAQITE
jgi:ABC-2 type transport system permease protein